MVTTRWKVKDEVTEETIPCICVPPKLATLGHCGKAPGWFSVANSALNMCCQEERRYYGL